MSISRFLQITPSGDIWYEVEQIINDLFGEVANFVLEFFLTAIFNLFDVFVTGGIFGNVAGIALSAVLLGTTLILLSKNGLF